MRTAPDRPAFVFALLALVFAAAPVLPAAEPRSEEQKIQALIDGVRNLGDQAVFIRNGSEHSAKDAAEHMAGKRKSAGDRVKTAKAFIARCASKSSLSGKPYQIKFRDGKTATAEQYLTEQLAKLEASGKR